MRAAGDSRGCIHVENRVTLVSLCSRSMLTSSTAPITYDWVPVIGVRPTIADGDRWSEVDRGPLRQGAAFALAQSDQGCGIHQHRPR
jgi:hypothetical protein